MKAFIMAADALTPEYIFKKREMFPNMCNMMKQGAYSAYSAYVQKGYSGSYTSEQNWASIYTGLTPQEHLIGTNKYSKQGVVYPKMPEFNSVQPFWQVLNESGLSVGLWSANCCDNPVEIDGYVVSSRYSPIISASETRETPREIVVCEKDSVMLKFLNKTTPPRLYPQTLKQHGLTFEELKTNPSLIDTVVNENNFANMIDNFNDELDFWFSAIRKAQNEYPVDVIHLFTPTTDVLAHFTLYCDNNPILIKAYKLLDHYIGKFINEFKPEFTVLISDHGQQNFKYIINSTDPIIQREAFSARDKVIWLDNGYIAFEALNGGLLFSTHSLKGCFIASGNGIKHTQIKNMRTIDIYPTLLEMFGVKIPQNRKGYVVDIFNKPLVNDEKLLTVRKHKKIALLQNHEVSIMDIILNEFYIEHRFADITVVGDLRYKEIFLNNPRVCGFIPFDKLKIENFDEVYCGYCNEDNNQMYHVRIKK